MNIDHILKSQHAPRVTLIVIEHAGASYYLSDRPYITHGSDAPANRPFAPIITKNGIGRLRWSVQGPFTGETVAAFGTITLASHRIPGTDGINELELDLTETDIRNATVRIYLAPQVDQRNGRLIRYRDRILIASAVVTEQNIVGNTAEITIAPYWDQLYQTVIPTAVNAQYDTQQIIFGSPYPHAAARLEDEITMEYSYNAEPASLEAVTDNGAEMWLSAPATSVNGNLVQLGQNHGLDTTAAADFYNGCIFTGVGNENYRVTNWDAATDTLTIDRNYVGTPDGNERLSAWRPIQSRTERPFHSDGRFELRIQPVGVVGVKTTGSEDKSGSPIERAHRFITEMLNRHGAIEAEAENADDPEMSGGQRFRFDFSEPWMVKQWSPSTVMTALPKVAFTSAGASIGSNHQAWIRNFVDNARARQLAGRRVKLKMTYQNANPGEKPGSAIALLWNDPQAKELVANGAGPFSSTPGAYGFWTISIYRNDNICDFSWFKPGSLVGMDPNAPHGDHRISKVGGDTENEAIFAKGPFDYEEPLWLCTNKDSSNDAEGGFNYYAPIVVGSGWHSRTVRFSVWVKRIDSNNGTTYMGTTRGEGDSTNAPARVTTLGGVDNSNPYFWYGDLPELNKWYLIVGYLYPPGTTGATNQGGIYDGVTKQKVASGNDFIMKSNCDSLDLRCYYHYDPSVEQHRQLFCRPRIEIVDYAPTVSELLNDQPKYDIQPGDLVEAKADVWVDQAARDAGAESRFYIYSMYFDLATSSAGWWASSSQASNTTTPTPVKNEIAIPTIKTRFGYMLRSVWLAAYHYPGSVTDGTAYIQNISAKVVGKHVSVDDDYQTKDISNTTEMVVDIPTKTTSITIGIASGYNGSYTPNAIQIERLSMYPVDRIAIDPLDGDLYSKIAIQVNTPRKLVNLITETVRGLGAYWTIQRDGRVLVRKYRGGIAGIHPVNTITPELVLDDPQWRWHEDLVNAIVYRFWHNGQPIINPASGLPLQLKEHLRQPYFERRYDKTMPYVTVPDYPQASSDPTVLSYCAESYVQQGVSEWLLQHVFGIPRRLITITVPIRHIVYDVGQAVTLSGFGALDGDYEIWYVEDQVGGRFPIQELTLWG